MTPTITVDASSWRTAMDAVRGLKEVLRPTGGHGSSIDAFIDSMIYGGMLHVEPPYEVIVEGLAPSEAQSFVDDLSTALVEARAERRAEYGVDMEVSVRRVR